VSLDAVVHLRSAASAVVGLCGNWGLVTRTVPAWYEIFSFVGPMGIPKAEMLVQVRRYCPADDYVMVGKRSAALRELRRCRGRGWGGVAVHPRARFRGRRSVIANPRRRLATTPLRCLARA
jgi:hypothetical protein